MASARQNAAFIRALRRQVAALEKPLAKELRDSFDALGEQAADIYLALVASDAKALWVKRTDSQTAAQITRALKLGEWSDMHLKKPLERHYVRMGRAAAELANEHYDLGVMLPAPAERELLRRGGTRAGLVDIEGETRTAIINAVKEGREAGDGAEAIARRIRQDVPAGRYTQLAKTPLADGSNRGSFYRSKTIARAESKTAQNYSTLQAYKEAPNVTKVEASDAQIGDDHAPECEARDGQVFTIEEAEGEELTHPNCSLSWTPIVE